MSKLEPRVVAITGGAQGLGRGLALALARDGWRVAISDIDASGVAETSRLVTEDGGICRSWVGDMSVSDDIELFVREAEQELGPIDALFNNAIDAREGLFLELSEADWRRTIDVSLTGYFLVAQAVARRMVERGYGRIVNMSSGSAERGIPRTGSYASAKGGVNSLTRVMAVELATSGVTVNTLTTGPVETETFAAVAKTAKGVEARRRRVPMGRFGTIDDIVDLARYLISPTSAWTTGGLFHVDGGANNAALTQESEQ